MSFLTLDEALDLAQKIGLSQSKNIPAQREDMLQELAYKALCVWEFYEERVTAQLIGRACKNAAINLKTRLPLVRVHSSSFSDLQKKALKAGKTKEEFAEEMRYKEVTDSGEHIRAVKSDAQRVFDIDDLLKEICHTQMEYTILQDIAAGKTQTAIAQQVGYTPPGIHNILKKLGERYVRCK